MKLPKKIFLLGLTVGGLCGFFQLNEGLLPLCTQMFLKIEGIHSLPNQDTTLVSPILSQTFTYLGRGGQFFAFSSEDGKYVLKFPKYYKFFSFPFDQIIPGYKRRKEALIESMTIAATIMHDDTAIIYAQLSKNKTRELPTVKFIDHLGFNHFINLNNIPFLVQKHITPTYIHLNALLEIGDKQKLKESLDGLHQALSTLPPPGIISSDLIIHKNYGFIGSKAYKLDIGDFAFDQTGNGKEKFQKASKKEKAKLRFWTLVNAPDLLERESVE